MYSLFLACPARLEARISHKWQTFLENPGSRAVVAVVPWKQMGSLNPHRKQQPWIWFKCGMSFVQRRSAVSVICQHFSAGFYSLSSICGPSPCFVFLWFGSTTLTNNKKQIVAHWHQYRQNLVVGSENRFQSGIAPLQLAPGTPSQINQRCIYLLVHLRHVESISFSGTLSRPRLTLKVGIRAGPSCFHTVGCLRR